VTCLGGTGSEDLSDALIGVLVGGVISLAASVGATWLTQRAQDRRERFVEERAVREAKRLEARTARDGLIGASRRILMCTTRLRSIERQIRRAIAHDDLAGCAPALAGTDELERTLDEEYAVVALFGSERLLRDAREVRMAFGMYRDVLELQVDRDPNLTGEFIRDQTSPLSRAESQLKKSLTEQLGRFEAAPA